MQFMYHGKTISGRFEHTSVPQGLSSSMDSFVEALTSILALIADFPIVEVDNILILVNSKDQLQKRFNKLLRIYKENGVQLRCKSAR